MQKKKIIILTVIIALLILLILSINMIRQQNKNKLNLSENVARGETIVEPNIPVLSAGMIPVKWNGEQWIITTANDWYDYKNGKPAYMMINDGYYKSELEQGVKEEQLMQNNVGEAVLGDPQIRGSIYMWIPRFATNEEGDIQYINGIGNAEDGWTIPELFAYRQASETSPDFLLTGAWIAIDTDANLSITITQMNSEESIYGFIKNTIAVANDQTNQNTIETYINKFNETSSANVGAFIARPQMNDLTNPNRIILKIINDKNQEPMKVKGVYNKETGLIEIQVTYSQYGISQVLYEDTQELKLTKNNNRATATSEGIDVEDGERIITIVDNNGNTKELGIQVISRIYATLYTDGTLAFGKSENPIPEKTISAKYGEILVNGYTSSAYVPWFGHSDNIKTVNFVEEIYLKSAYSLFNQCQYLTKVENISNLKGVTDMSYMFSHCSNLSEIDLSELDTRNVTNMSYMFSGCRGLTELDVSNFDTRNVTNMNSMFSDCMELTELDVSNFDTSNVTDMNSMFSYCRGLTELNVSNFNTSNVTNMSYMFSNCSGLTELDVSNFNTSNVTNMSYMFSGCSGLTELNVSNFNTSNVTNMMRMFNSCNRLAGLDISNFDTRNATNMNNMFSYSINLKTIYVGENWTTDNATTTEMFYNCGTSTVTRK